VSGCVSETVASSPVAMGVSSNSLQNSTLDCHTATRLQALIEANFQVYNE
jgi:hypothetical protein